MKETMLDKCIKANFKMVDNEIAISATMMLAMAFFIMAFWTTFLAPIPVIVAVVYMFKMYKKLFYTSMYGATATTYQALPVTMAETAAAKIFVAGAGVLLVNIVEFAVAVLIVTGYNLIDGPLMAEILGTLDAGINLANMTYILPLEFVNLVVSCFWQGALIFMAVVIYKTVAGRKNKGIKGVAVVVCAVIINYVLADCTAVLGLLGMKYSLWNPVMGIVVGIAALVIMFRITAKLLEEKYELR